MGKHLWRKQSYVRVEKEDPGCVWTVFRLMNYHPWHNVKKMLPYINHHKPHKSSFKVSDEPIEFNDTHDFDEDAMTNYSASVTSSPSRSGSGSRKRSLKARIKALLADKTNKSGKVNTIQEHELLALKEACNDFGAPTLISLLNANPKLIATFNPVDDSTNNLTRTTSVNRPKDSKEEYVGVLELFKVDQEVFRLKILQDSPPKKHRLMKSGSFPFSKSSSSNSSTLGRTPSKLEHKHNEVWPTPNQGFELRKAKSHNIVRSSSLKDSLEKYGRLIDTTSNNKRILNKELSKSLKLTNEKEFALSGQHGRRSFRERMFMPEDESDAPRASLDSFLNHISRGDDVRVLRLDSPPGELNGQSHKTTLTESNIDIHSTTSFGAEQGETIPEVEIVEVTEDHSRHRNEGFSSISGSDVECQLDQIECVEWPILEGSTTMSHSTSTLEIREEVQEDPEIDNGNENLQYVRYVLDIIGFTTTSNELLELKAWHSPEQPLDPAIFDGIEICCPFEPKPSSNKEMVVMSSFQRKILFDLINEALFVIHENSYAYYPKALGNSCIVHPELKGKSRVVEQVWEFVDEWITWTPEVDAELNVAVAHDLSRHKSGWSNLQTDCELLAIDLEDWIFSGLLDEIICC